MPNWTYNSIRVEDGNCDLSKYIVETGDFDFNLLVSEPQTVYECVREYGEKYVDDGTKRLAHNDGKDWFDWYSWHNDYWGTKWNACNSYYDEKENVVTFDTAWCAPFPIFEKLSKDNPDCIFKIYCEFECEGGYELTARNGRVKIDKEWDSYDSEEDEEWEAEICVEW